MKKYGSFQRTVILVCALSFSIFAAPRAVVIPQTFPYAVVTPAAPTQSDSVIMQLILGDNSNNCVSPFICAFRITRTSNNTCVRAPCPQDYLIKIGYAPDLRPIGLMCPMIAGPYGPTYRFGVLNVGSYTVVDTMAGNDTLLSFTVSEKSNSISISGSVTKWNALIYDSGPAVVGAKVYLKSPNNPALLSSLTDAIVMPVIYYPVIDSAVTDNNGAYSFAGHSSGSYMVAVSAANYQVYSTPAMTLTKDTALKTVLLPINATGAVSGTVSSYASCHYVNNIPLCTGVLAPVAGCSVTVTFPPLIMLPLAETAAAILPTNLTTVTDNSGHYSFPSIPITYANQPIIVIAAKSGYNQQRASISLITTPGAIQNFSLESSYSNSNTIEKTGIRYTIATNKASYTITDSIFARYTVENISTTPDTFSFGSGCQYDMSVVKPPSDTLYRYLKGMGCIAMMTKIILQPNQTAVMDFHGWKSDVAYDSLRIGAMLAGLPASAASIDVHFNKPITGINFNAHAMAVPFKGAIMAFDRLSNVKAFRCIRPIHTTRSVRA